MTICHGRKSFCIRILQFFIKTLLVSIVMTQHQKNCWVSLIIKSECSMSFWQHVNLSGAELDCNFISKILQRITWQVHTDCPLCRGLELVERGGRFLSLLDFESFPSDLIPLETASFLRGDFSSALSPLLFLPSRGDTPILIHGLGQRKWGKIPRLKENLMNAP